MHPSKGFSRLFNVSAYGTTNRPFISVTEMVTADWALPRPLAFRQLVFGVLANVFSFALLLMTALAEMGVAPK